jgi:hypothetical protein
VPQVQVVRRCHALQDLTEEENTMPDLPDLVIEYSIDSGVTWHHGKTVRGRVRHDKRALKAERAAVREQANAGHDYAMIITRLRPEGDPRAVLKRPGRAAERGAAERMAAAEGEAAERRAATARQAAAERRAALVRQAVAEHRSAAVPGPADDELSRQQAAEALAEWQEAMTDEGSLGDMLAAGQQMAEFIAGWLDAAGMPEGVDNPGYFGLGGPTS